MAILFEFQLGSVGLLNLVLEIQAILGEGKIKHFVIETPGSEHERVGCGTTEINLPALGGETFGSQFEAVLTSDVALVIEYDHLPCALDIHGIEACYSLLGEGCHEDHKHCQNSQIFTQ